MKKITQRDRTLAKICLMCTVCKYARKKQRGYIYNFVRKIERYFCPFCRAYERVYGKKAHEKI